MSSFGSIIKVKNNDNDVYLLVKGKYTGKWSFPKGHIKKGETQLQCALRETKEETGIDLNEYKPATRKFLKRYFKFTLPNIPETKIIDNTEIEEIRWMTKKEIEEVHGNIDVSCFSKKIKPNIVMMIKSKGFEIEKQPEKITSEDKFKLLLEYCKEKGELPKSDKVIQEQKIEKQPEIQPIKQPEKTYCSWTNMIKGKVEIEKQPEIQPDPEKEFLDYYNQTASKHEYYQDRDMQLWYIIKLNY